MEGISDPYMASYDQAMSFLSNMFYEEKWKYGKIAVARSTILAILPKINGQTFGKDERVNTMIKGIFKLHPSLPKKYSNLRPWYHSSVSGFITCKQAIIHECFHWKIMYFA